MDAYIRTYKDRHRGSYKDRRVEMIVS